jgi:hypothetical protein
VQQAQRDEQRRTRRLAQHRRQQNIKEEIQAAVARVRTRRNKSRSERS